MDNVDSRVRKIKLGELWSTSHKDLEVQLYPPSRFFGKPYFGLYEIFTLAIK